MAGLGNIVRDRGRGRQVGVLILFVLVLGLTADPRNKTIYELREDLRSQIDQHANPIILLLERICKYAIFEDSQTWNAISEANSKIFSHYNTTNSTISTWINIFEDISRLTEGQIETNDLVTYIGKIQSQSYITYTVHERTIVTTPPPHKFHFRY